MRKILLWVWALAIAGAAGATDDQAVRGALHAYLEEAAAQGFVGAVVVARGDETLLAEGYGTLSADGRSPVTVDTVSTMGSITKQFTAAAVVKLAAEGRLSLDDPISRHFDGVPPDKAGITIHQLLSHQAGFPGAIGPDRERIGRDAFVDLALGTELLFEPGTAYEYSNVGYSLAAAIVEQRSGLGYEDYLTTRLFEPAGMAATGYLRPGWARDRLAVGRKGDGTDWGTVYDAALADGGPGWHLLGNGGLHTTPADMLAWHRALRDGIVLPKDVEARLYGRYADEGGGTWYGYGWSIEPTPWGEDLIAHNGGNPYYFADFLRFLDSDVVIYLWTVSPDDRMKRMGRPLAEIVFTGDAPAFPSPPAPLTPADRGDPGSDHLPTRWGLPDTPEGLRAAQLTELFLGAEGPDRAALIEAVFDAGVIERNSTDGLLALFDRLRADLSPATLEGTRMIGTDEVAVVFDSMKGEATLQAPLGPAPERRVMGLGVELN